MNKYLKLMKVAVDIINLKSINSLKPCLAGTCLSGHMI